MAFISLFVGLVVLYSLYAAWAYNPDTPPHIDTIGSACLRFWVYVGMFTKVEPAPDKDGPV